MNILVHEAMAEVVHIDLGVAFDQGLMLKTPERIPFRLTRDIVDGMGLCGVEGVFRRCCEATLSVMRSNKDALLTIIEVAPPCLASPRLASPPLSLSAPTPQTGPAWPSHGEALAQHSGDLVGGTATSGGALSYLVEKRVDT
eukprot:jgi/Mesen1/7190/ME000371S06280